MEEMNASPSLTGSEFRGSPRLRDVAQDIPEFRIQISDPRQKFNAAHFVAYDGFRECLHGHNYHMEVSLWGKVNNDGYVLDFGVVKKLVQELCKSLNEKFLVPMKSDVLQINEEDDQMKLVCQDGAKFSFPRQDCILLPITHSTVEKLSEYMMEQICNRLVDVLLERGVRIVEVVVGETPTQKAHCTRVLS